MNASVTQAESAHERAKERWRVRGAVGGWPGEVRHAEREQLALREEQKSMFEVEGNRVSRLLAFPRHSSSFFFSLDFYFSVRVFAVLFVAFFFARASTTNSHYYVLSSLLFSAGTCCRHRRRAASEKGTLPIRKMPRCHDAVAMVSCSPKITL